MMNLAEAAALLKDKAGNNPHLFAAAGAYLMSHYSTPEGRAQLRPFSVAPAVTYARRPGDSEDIGYPEPETGSRRLDVGTNRTRDQAPAARGGLSGSCQCRQCVADAAAARAAAMDHVIGSIDARLDAVLSVTEQALLRDPSRELPPGPDDVELLSERARARLSLDQAAFRKITARARQFWESA